MYAAIMNLPDHAPEFKINYYNTAREAWDYLISELKRDRAAEIELEVDPTLEEFDYGLRFATESRDLDTAGYVEVVGLMYQVVRFE